MPEVTTKQVKAAAFLILAIAALAFVYQYGRSLDQTYPNRTFSVQGEADIETPNDIAFFTASVITEGEGDVTALQGENTEKMNRINTFLGEQGIEKRDQKTTNYSMNPRYNYPNCTGQTTCPPATINGYTITQSLEVKVRQAERVGELLSGIVGAGSNSVSGVSFITDDDSDARMEARKQAFEDARQKAYATAQAGGFHIGKMVTFYEDNAFPAQPMMANAYGGDMTMSEKAMPAPMLEPGVSSGKMRVTLIYEIR